ncbi:hypothetical protein GC163_24470 [bacterium]|nr:hypothetical protein [bacterium]
MRNRIFPAFLLVAGIATFSVSSAHASDCGATSTGLVPINELVGQSYLDIFPGGLYPDGSNSVPDSHAQEGMARAGTVQPLDSGGHPDPNGVAVLLSVGLSNTTLEFSRFRTDAFAHPDVNTDYLVLANGAASGQSASAWTSSSASNYDRVRDSVLAPSGLTEAQVQVVWVKVANPAPLISLPDPQADAFVLTRQLGDIARALAVRYPNLQMVFISSRTYAGYADTTLNPEPFAYESGFAVKWVVEAQIRQMAGEDIDPRAGDLDLATGAPWLAWGPYLWADGLTPRNDGLIWECTDFAQDGTHPSASGNRKVSELLLEFFLQSSFAKPWFGKASSGTLTLITPNGGESYVQGTIERIAWVPTGSPGETVWIRLHKDNRFLDVTRATEDDGVYDWAVPTFLSDANDYLIEVAPIADTALGDFSDGFFSIGAGQGGLTVLTPNGGESLVKGAQDTIAWSGTTFSQSVLIRLVFGPHSLTLASSTPGDGEFIWTVPAWIPDATGYRIEVMSLANPADTDSSDGPFTIQTAAASGELTVVSPNGGEVWKRGEQVAIAWNTRLSSSETVRIRLRNSDKALIVAVGTPNDGAFLWTVPAWLPASEGFSIEVALEPDYQISDSSDSGFSID